MELGFDPRWRMEAHQTQEFPEKDAQTSHKTAELKPDVAVSDPKQAYLLGKSSEPARNRTGNLQIKSSTRTHPHASVVVRTVGFIDFVCPADGGTFAEVRPLVYQLECHPLSLCPL